MKLPAPWTRKLVTVPAALLLMAGMASATISVTTAGYTNDFTEAPVAGDWITSASNIAGTDATFASPADVDTFVITNNYNAAGLGTALGTSSTDPPSVHHLARYNTTRLALQMRPRIGTAGSTTEPLKAANVLVARIQNNTGSFIPSIDVSYTFANPGTGVEEIPGWQAYYSITGNSNWIKIPEFSTATPGALTANLNFGGAGWNSGALAYILWVDDNALLLDANEASYTLDDFSISVPVTGTIAAVVSNVTRGLGANTSDPSDDTVSFEATITGNNLPAGTPGWTTTGGIPNPPVTGTYGSSFTVSNVPLSTLPVTIGLADRMDPAIIGNFTVTTASLPPYIALNLIGGASFVQLDPASAPQWVADGGAMSIFLNNGGATAVTASTTPITFSAGSPKCVSLILEAQDTSTGTNFEAADTLRVELVTDAGTQVLTGVLDKDNSGAVNGYSDATPDPYNDFPLRDEFNRGGSLMADTFNNFFRLHGVIPAAATTAQLVITGANDSGSETFRVHDVVFMTCNDSDGDGVFDSEESVTGTDPNDAASFFRLLSQDCTDGIYSLSVPTVGTRTYQLDTSTDLLIWTPQAAAVTGTGAAMTFTTPCDVPRKFARITVQ
jgi:hypothetical protein